MDLSLILVGSVVLIIFRFARAALRALLATTGSRLRRIAAAIRQSLTQIPWLRLRALFPPRFCLPVGRQSHRGNVWHCPRYRSVGDRPQSSAIAADCVLIPLRGKSGLPPAQPFAKKKCCTRVSLRSCTPLRFALVLHFFLLSASCVVSRSYSRRSARGSLSRLLQLRPPYRSGLAKDRARAPLALCRPLLEFCAPAGRQRLRLCHAFCSCALPIGRAWQKIAPEACCCAGGSPRAPLSLRALSLPPLAQCAGGARLCSVFACAPLGLLYASAFPCRGCGALWLVWSGFVFFVLFSAFFFVFSCFVRWFSVS